MKNLILYLALIMFMFTVVQAQPGPPPEGSPVSSERSIDFDGTDDYVNFSTATNLIDAGSSSISLWVRLNGVKTATGHFSYLFTNEDGHIQLRIDPGCPSVWRLAIHNTTPLVTRYSQPISLNLGTWYHIVCTWETDSIPKIFMNGVAFPVGTGTTPAITNPTKNFILGMHPTPHINMKVDCTIHRMEFWSTALTRAEVTTLYNGGVPRDPAGLPNLTHSYHFGNGSDVTPTVVDNTANPAQRNGTMLPSVGPPTFIFDAP